MAITSSSPVTFVFARSGGADTKAELQIWPSKDDYTSNDRPISILDFDKATQSKETQEANLPNGIYKCVFLTLVREALNGVFEYNLNANGSEACANKGDVNTSSSPNDLQNYKCEFELIVV